MPERAQRGVSGAAKMVAGVAQAAGAAALVVKSGASLTSVGTIVFMHGGYKFATGAHQLANAISGVSAEQDPKFNTPAGEATQSELVDNAVDLTVGLGVRGVDNVIDGVNIASSVHSLIETVKSIDNNTQSFSDEEKIDRER
jgi:hypothetical protein